MPITSPEMGLPIPVVGVDPAPTWAALINQCLTIIDSHDHTNGSGVPISPGAININSDLTFNSNNAIALRASRFTSQVSPITASGSDLNEIYVSGVDLYYNDGNGNQVRITQSGGVAGSPGSISNLTSPASASYVAVSSKFVWQSAANTSADMDFGSAIMRNNTLSSFALTLQPPTLGANYSITLPALPASQKIMTMDASGVMSAPYTVDGTTIAINANILGVPDGGIGPDQLAALNIDQSSSSGSYVSSSNTFATPTNLSKVFTTSGRPLRVELLPDGTTSVVGSFVSASSDRTTFWQFRRDGTVIAFGAFTGSLPPAAFSVIDRNAPLGSYTYDFQIKNSTSGGNAFAVSFSIISIYEID